LESDLDAANEALEATEQAPTMLPALVGESPMGRHGPFLRELVVRFGSAGHVVPFEDQQSRHGHGPRRV
jgi:hypothetical protein